MAKLLTISIPTYNRARMLAGQFEWFAAEIKGYEAECDLVINDNCSTDDTEQVVAKWTEALGSNVQVTYNRHQKNIGGMANIVHCLNAATGKFVWSLGDDDPIEKGTLSYLVSILKKHEDLSLVLLNGYGRDTNTGKIIHERWFESDSDEPRTNSAREFQHFLSRNMGGVLFISSAVYKTDVVKKALLTWPDTAKNLASQAYWVAYCAVHGTFIVTPKLYTECAMGIGFTDKDPQWMFKMAFMGIPEVYLKLMGVGFSRRFCFSRMVENFRSVNGWRILFGSFKRWFPFTTKGFIFYLSCVGGGVWNFFVLPHAEPLHSEAPKHG